MPYKLTYSPIIAELDAESNIVNTNVLLFAADEAPAIGDVDVEDANSLNPARNYIALLSFIGNISEDVSESARHVIQ